MLQILEELSYIDEYLSLSRKNSTIIKSITRLREEFLPKLNHTGVHMYIWFTNLPTVEDEENLEPHEKSPGGITGKADKPVICTAVNVALVRGPSRLDQNTAGVETFKNIYDKLLLNINNNL